MRLDPRHFNRFMAITAVFSMAAIAFFTIRHQRGKEVAFDAEIRSAFPAWWAQAGAEDLPDVFPASEAEHAAAVNASQSALEPISIIVFWAPWSERSLEVLRSVDQALAGWDGQPVAYSDTLPDPKGAPESAAGSMASSRHARRLYALGVKDSREAMREAARSSGIKAVWLDGTKAYADLAVPGIPTLIVLDSKGGVAQVDIGTNPADVPAILRQASP